MSDTVLLQHKQLIRNILCVSVGILCFLTLFFYLRPLYSLGGSMLPTIEDGQFLAVMPKALNLLLKVQHKDVVIVRCREKNILLTKRLIAMPGDTLEIRDNCIYVNGTLLNEPYLYESAHTEDVAPFVLGEDMYYVLGDNRNISADSRHYGSFSEADIFAVVDLENQQLHWILIAILIANVFIWIAYLPDWSNCDTKALPSASPEQAALSTPTENGLATGHRFLSIR